MNHNDRQAYWRANLRLVSILLSVWAIASLGASVLFVDVLNSWGRVLDAPLGFWMAQQGSIITFVTLIGIYVLRMERLDKSFDIDEEAELAAGVTSPGEAH